MGTFDLATTPSKGGFSSSTLILILIVVVAFYFLMIRPQQRRKQQAAQQSNNVEPGARVRTTAGMYATVVDVDGDDVILEVAPGVEVRYMKRAIMEVVSPGDPVDVTDTDSDEADEDELHRGGAVVLGREALGVIDVELIRGAVLLLAAETGEAGHGRLAVGAVAPGAAGPPGELRRFRCGRQRVAGIEQGLDVHAVVDGMVGDGHRCLL